MCANFIVKLSHIWKYSGYLKIVFGENTSSFDQPLLKEVFANKSLDYMLSWKVYRKEIRSKNLNRFWEILSKTHIFFGWIWKVTVMGLWVNIGPFWAQNSLFLIQHIQKKTV